MFAVHPGDDGVFYLSGDLDIVAAQHFETSVQSCLDGQGEVVLDVQNLAFVDSTGLRAIVRLAKQVHPRMVVLRAPRPRVARVLDIVRIETLGIRVDGNTPD